jgi:ketosteroid isomerase-like protein
MSDADFLAQVEEANLRFYRAFETLDLAQMDAVWLHTERAQCVHPGWPLIVGWAAIRDSWETIFANTTEMRFTIGDARVAGGPDLAWVTCTENILADVQGRVSVTSLLATNVFEHASDGWRMVHHHASHVLGSTDRV